MPDQHCTRDIRHMQVDVPFRVQLAQEQLLTAAQRKKRDMVLSRHLVFGGNIVLPIDQLYADLLPCLLQRLWSQYFAAAGHGGIGGRSDKIAAIGAYVELQML